MIWRFWLSNKTVRKFEELPIYCQRQNCSPGILVSSRVWFMWIFAGVWWKGASNDSGVVQNGDFRFFRSLYLPNLHIQVYNYYIVLCSPLVALHWRRNGWPWMTLNGHFALKSGPSSASNGLSFWLSEKTAWKFVELYAYTVSGNKKISPARDCTGEWWYKCYGVIRWRYPKRQRQTSECIHTHSSHTCRSLSVCHWRL